MKYNYYFISCLKTNRVTIYIPKSPDIKPLGVFFLPTQEDKM